MSARTPFAAVRALRDRLGRALLCVTEPHFLVSPGGYEPATGSHGLALAGDPVLLQGDGAIALSVRYYYRIVRVEGRRPWQAETAAYYYTFLDNHGREIIGYHWHPTTPDVTFPHLHVEPGAVRMDILERAGLPPTSNALRVDITAAHFPTHQVTPEEMVRLAIAQFRVRPRRSDWEAVLRTRPR